MACLCTGVHDIFIAFQCNLIFYFCLSGGCSAFSVGDILEMDVEISKFPEFSMVESGALILAWAVFLCLVLSLPESNTNLVMMIFCITLLQCY